MDKNLVVKGSGSNHFGEALVKFNIFCIFKLLAQKFTVCAIICICMYIPSLASQLFLCMGAEKTFFPPSHIKKMADLQDLYIPCLHQPHSSNILPLLLQTDRHRV